MANIYIWNPVSKEMVHKFHVEYMTHPMQKKHSIHREQIIKIFESAFKPVTLKIIKIS